LDKALSSSNATPTSPTNVDLPQPLPDHIIMRLTYAFKQATSKLQDMESLAAINTRYIKHLETNGDLFTKTAPTSLQPASRHEPP